MTRVAASHAEGILAAARGDRRAAVDALLAAAEGARAIPAPFVAARALERLGTVVPGEASIAHLVEAGRLYASLPAPAFEQRVLARLRTVGPAGRRASQSVGALTVREREIAALARSGLSTKTIAGRLHLSERTVESHLAHVYRKLQIEGRHELGRWDPASERT